MANPLWVRAWERLRNLFVMVKHGLLVDPSSASEVADALIELLGDPERARRMGEAARQFVTSEFSFESFCKRLQEGLQE